jgi:hypothetical protein
LSIESLVAEVTGRVAGELLGEVALDLGSREFATQVLVDSQIRDGVEDVRSYPLDALDVEQLWTLLAQRHRTRGTGGDGVVALPLRSDIEETLTSAWRRASANTPFASSIERAGSVGRWRQLVGRPRRRHRPGVCRRLRPDESRPSGRSGSRDRRGCTDQWGRASGAAANVGDAHPALVVGLPPLGTVPWFTDGIDDEREVGDTSGGPLGVRAYPLVVVGGGVPREAESNGDACGGLCEKDPIKARSRGST